MGFAAVVAGVISVAAFAAVVRSANSAGERHRVALLRADGDFGLSGSVGDLTPGIGTHLVLTASNPSGAPITVTSVRVAVTGVPAGCPVSYLSLNGSAFSGRPPAVTIGSLAVTVTAHRSAPIPVPILLARDAPNACQVTTFAFGYAGTARAGPTAIVVTLASDGSPSLYGRPVRLTAIATGGGGPMSGWVRFRLCLAPPALPPGSPASACPYSVAIGPLAWTSPGHPAKVTVSDLPPGYDALFVTFRAFGSSPAGSAASTTITQEVVGGRPCPPGHNVCRGRP